MRFSSKFRQRICCAVLLLTPEIVDGGGIDISDRAKSSIVNVNSAYTDSDLLDPQSSSPPSQMGIFTQVLGDPGNLELNFLLFKKQLAENNVKGATATLERVLLTDPKSKLARVMYAQLKLRMGNRTEGLRNLNQIVQDETASDDMRRNAASLRDGIKRAEQMNVRGIPRKKFVSRFKLGVELPKTRLAPLRKPKLLF